MQDSVFVFFKFLDVELVNYIKTKTGVPEPRLQRGLLVLKKH